MSMTDPTSDFLTRIRNAGMAKHSMLEVPSSKMKVAIADLLKKEGYIWDYRVVEGIGQCRLQIRLKYDRKQKPVISGIKRVSKPGLRVYVGYREIPKVLNGLGVAVISNTSGIMSGQESLNRKLGGEWICSVW